MINSENVPTPLSTSSKSTPPIIRPVTATPSLTPSILPQKRLGTPIETPIIQEHSQEAIAKARNAELVETQPGESNGTTGEPESSLHTLESLSSQNVIVSPDSGTNTHISPPSTIASPSRVTPPAAKRRRLEVGNKDGASIHGSVHNDVTLPTPSRARDGVATGAGENIDIGSSAKRIEANQQPTKTRKPRLSAKAKGKQPVQQVAVEIVTDAVQGSSDSALRTGKLKKLAYKRRNPTVEAAAANIVAHAVQGSSAKKRGNRGRKPREVTPEGAETVKIMPSKVRMSELCKNSRTGKKSTREKELNELDQAEAVRKSQNQLQEVLGAVDTSATDPSETAESRLERLARAAEESARVVPNTIIIDGEIQIDETSLQIDRHANAAMERDAEALEGIDESELTRRVNSNSWLKRDPGGRWNEESTEKFFEALRMFGTSFDMISKLFPGRTRHAIKRKFLKEERTNPQRIRQTLMGERILVDMEEYSRITNTIYEDPKELEKDLADDRKRMEAEQAAANEALQESTRQREREVEAERAAAEQEDEAEAEEEEEVSSSSPLAKAVQTTASELEKVRKTRSRGGKAKVGKKTGRTRVGKKKLVEASEAS